MAILHFVGRVLRSLSSRRCGALLGSAVYIVYSNARSWPFLVRRCFRFFTFFFFAGTSPNTHVVMMDCFTRVSFAPPKGSPLPVAENVSGQPTIIVLTYAIVRMCLPVVCSGAIRKGQNRKNATLSAGSRTPELCCDPFNLILFSSLSRPATRVRYLSLSRISPCLPSASFLLSFFILSSLALLHLSQYKA